MSNENSKWKKTPENPNISGTEVGKLLEHLRTLEAHYEGKLQEDLGNLAVLEQALAKWELQKRNRKVDPNG
tara:strand:- start:466 stop:678 length:213 start_codon:yes stop_codon:yes gene_type:complete